MVTSETEETFPLWTQAALGFWDFNTWPVDPVCRQKVRPEVAEQVTYQGKIYYLCSPDCARRFAEAPASWLEPTSGPAQDKEARPIPALKPLGRAPGERFLLAWVPAIYGVEVDFIGR